LFNFGDYNRKIKTSLKKYNFIKKKEVTEDYYHIENIKIPKNIATGHRAIYVMLRYGSKPTVVKHYKNN
jgi:hypothetical protein